MKEQQIIKKAKSFLKKEIVEDCERLRNYHYSRDLLLDNGFINNDNATLKEVYYDMFPTNKFLEEELKTSLKDILSNNEEIRLEASKYLQKAPADVVNLNDKLWLKEPKTIEILCKALESETNNKIIENIILSLGNIAERYGYNDISIFTLITSKFALANDKLKITIAQSCGEFPTDEKWKYIYQALDCKPKKSAIIRLTVDIRHQHQKMPLEVKNLFKEKMLREFYDEKSKNEEVKTAALHTAVVLMEKEDLEELKSIRDNYTVWKSTEGIIKRRIEELENE